VRARGLTIGLTGSAIIALAFALSPAFGASNEVRTVKPRLQLNARSGLGSFTPASSDARLAAVLARGGLAGTGFRFTPASTSASIRLNRSVTVAVRAGTNLGVVGGERTALVSAPASNIAPIAYNLGVSVGWKHFALSSDVAKVDLGLMGGRETADIGVSYNTRNWTTRLAIGNEHPLVGTPRALSAGTTAYSLDLGGSYKLSRNLDLTAGIRYRAPERDRLEVTDDRRDSQAVYIGTAFKF
jgi:hypothetical protein